jgi:Domain of unknown function (DUF4160)
MLEFAWCPNESYSLGITLPHFGCHPTRVLTRMAVAKSLAARLDGRSTMPEIHREDGYVFFVWSNDHLPPHVHIKKGGAAAKLELRRGRVVWREGFKGKDIRQVERIFRQNSSKIWSWWHERFGPENP